jgi:SAM-dependent methyltransferase
MQYDPVKSSLGRFFNQTPGLRILFYRLLDLLLLRTWHIKRELRKWARTHPGPRHILDAGSGFGQYAYFLSRMNHGHCILGVDVKEDQVSDCNRFFRAISRDKVLFKVADLTKFEKENCFDLSLCVDVLEHIEDDISVMRNIHRALRQGGVLLISTPSDQGGSDVHGDGDASFIEEHVRDGYNMQEIKDKLYRAGFSRVKAHYSYGRPGSIAWRLSMKWPLLALNVTKLFFVLLPFYYLLVFPICLLLNFMDSRMAHAKGTGLIVVAYKEE